jgi:hypothetical protein
MGIVGSSVDLDGQVIVAIPLVHEPKLAPLLSTGESDHDAAGHVAKLGEEVGELDEGIKGRRSAQDHSPGRNLSGYLGDPLCQGIVDGTSETTLDRGEVVKLLLENLRGEAACLKDFEGQRRQVDMAKSDASRQQEVEELVKVLAEVVFLLGRIDNEDARISAYRGIGTRL